MADRREAPEDDGDGVADLRPVAVDEPPEEEEADGVGPLEGRVHHPELLVRPAELDVEELLDERQDLPVDVVDRRGQEEEAADDPADAAHGRRGGGFGRGFGDGHPASPFGVADPGHATRSRSKASWSGRAASFSRAAATRVGGREPRRLREEEDVPGDPLRVEEPRLVADAVEAGPLRVAGGPVVAEARGGASRREDVEEVVLEEEHVVGRRREGRERGPEGPGRGERAVLAAPLVGEGVEDELPGEALPHRVAGEGALHREVAGEAVPVGPERRVARVRRAGERDAHLVGVAPGGLDLEPLPRHVAGDLVVPGRLAAPRVEADRGAEGAGDGVEALHRPPQLGVVGVGEVLLEADGGGDVVDLDAERLREGEADGERLRRGPSRELVDRELAEVAPADLRREELAADAGVGPVAEDELPHRGEERREEAPRLGLVEREAERGDAREDAPEEGRGVEGVERPGHVLGGVEGGRRRQLRGEVERDVAREGAPRAPAPPRSRRSGRRSAGGRR